MKVFIAARLLAEDKADDPEVRDRMHLMIVASDDDAASDLYPVAGGDGLVDWISQRYHVSGLTVTSDPGAWGLTGVTARAMVAFYSAVATDAKVGPSLLRRDGRRRQDGDRTGSTRTTASCRWPATGPSSRAGCAVWTAR